MINTFHSSFNPPPVPPRARYSKPQPAGNTALVKILSLMLLMLMMLTLGGFFYLFKKLNLLQLNGSYHEDQVRLNDCVKNKLGEDSVAECRELIENYKDIIERDSQANTKVSRLTAGSNGPVAHMVLITEHQDTSSQLRGSNNLVWDVEHSILQEVQLSSKRDMLIIQKPGIYFIYSQVTFSKQSKSALKQAIRITRDKKEDKELLKAFCSLNDSKSNLCTASLAGVFQLQKDQQLYVTVTNTSLVNRDSCSFGLFKLR
ncbi:CD40 ligand [Siphateles boraxobius]|uniref:CD40 ligand n=1 Tax=Siphateles boraxobius TaxID=180520 RepID=UPI0040629C97